MDTQEFYYQEFKDFDYLNPNEIDLSGNKTMFAFLKVFEDHDKSVYLGSLNMGFYFKNDEEKLKTCLRQVLSKNYPTYKDYELHLYIKKQSDE